MTPENQRIGPIVLRGARIATGPDACGLGTVTIREGRVSAIETGLEARHAAQPGVEIDLIGYLLLPGLINSHDHLGFSLFPRLGHAPYGNYIEWGKDIHERFPDTISKHRAVPKDVRLWWGGIRNLLCGVTTVCHHDPLFPELLGPGFPVRVVETYGWAHSPALGGDLRAARRATPAGSSFILHACEGIDRAAHDELGFLDALDVLDESAVLVHGLALDREGAALIKVRGASLIACPSSNEFLFHTLPDMRLFLDAARVALGNDSPLTAAGDLLDEVRFAIARCGISPREAYRMVTTVPAEILRLDGFRGSIREGGAADLIALRDTGLSPAERLSMLRADDVELVLVGGQVHLASDAMLDRLPQERVQGCELLLAGASARWLRAPVAELLERAEDVLGRDQVRLGERVVRSAVCIGVEDAS
jgi:cytosine/adenosine deaminase-related metal-dependent hydrolase